MKVTREQLIEAARKYRGVKFAHQGRSKEFGVDCGGLILMVGRELGLSELEELGYALFPTHGRFEQLLQENAIDLGEVGNAYSLNGTEFMPGDMLSFDYGVGEGIRHIAFVTKFDGRHFWVIEAHNLYNVCEHPLRPPFFNKKTKIRVWGVPDLEGGIEQSSAEGY